MPAISVGNVESENKQCVFVLKLRNDKYYVGEIADTSVNLLSNRMGTEIDILIYDIVNNVNWVRLHNPYTILALHKGNVDDITIHYMKKFGWKNVRGGRWKETAMIYPPVSLLPPVAMNIDKCFICGHTNHDAEQCTATINIYGEIIPKRCIKCSEWGHTKHECRGENNCSLPLSSLSKKRVQFDL